MKCNICETGNMKHDVVLSKFQEEDVIIAATGSSLYEKVMWKVAEEGANRFDGYHLTHIYNCEECPNSQIEFYFDEDAIAYSKAMIGKIKNEA